MRPKIHLVASRSASLPFCRVCRQRICGALFVPPFRLQFCCRQTRRGGEGPELNAAEWSFGRLYLSPSPSDRSTPSKDFNLTVSMCATRRIERRAAYRDEICVFLHDVNESLSERASIVACGKAKQV